MDIVVFLIELLKITLPAAIVGLVAYYLIKTYQEKEYKKELVALKMKSTESVLPMRLQSYERILLLLERITPSSLLIRVSGGALSAAEYQRILLSEIRSEYEHNVTQQLYVSDAAWVHVKRAKEDIVTLINHCSQQMNEKSRGTDLAKKVLETIINEERDPTYQAINFLKKEVQQLF